MTYPSEEAVNITRELIEYVKNKCTCEYKLIILAELKKIKDKAQEEYDNILGWNYG